MCYSALVEQSFKKLGLQYGASPWPAAFTEFETNQRVEQTAGAEAIKAILGLARKPTSTKFKWLGDDNRIYPHYFAPVIIGTQGDRQVVPMRYRLRPNGSAKEVPTKFNLYNARIESLHQVRSWKPLFGRHHAIVPLKQMFEWVNKQEIGIAPTDGATLNVAAIFDAWASSSGDIRFRSFAIITRPAPADILALGHPRCPVAVKSKHIDSWLNPNTPDQSMEILEDVAIAGFEKVAS